MLNVKGETDRQPVERSAKREGQRPSRIGVLLAILVFMPALAVVAQPLAIEETTLFSTGFEMSEGYDINVTLAGQNGWQSLSQSGNGLVNEFFSNRGQQAFIGYVSTDPNANGAVNVWRPLVTVPNTNLYPRVRFTVAMSIIDSSTTNAHYDDFRWSAYNARSERLFTLSFDNLTRLISYGLDDSVGFRSTGIVFTNQVLYNLLIEMNLARNTWSAVIDHGTLVFNAPITTKGAELNLSDIDAVWWMADPNAPGDNYMVFDDYLISADTGFELVNRPPNGPLVWRLHGRPNRSYVLESSTNWVQWSAVQTNTVSASGFLEFSDPSATDPRSPRYFYRARPEL